MFFGRGKEGKRGAERERKKRKSESSRFFFLRKSKKSRKSQKSQNSKKRRKKLTRKVRDRVRDVVVGHREDRELRDRAGAALDAAGALVDGREVGVPVFGKVAIFCEVWMSKEGGKKERKPQPRKTRPRKNF